MTIDWTQPICLDTVPPRMATCRRSMTLLLRMSAPPSTSGSL